MLKGNTSRVDPLLVLLLTAIWLFLVVRWMLQIGDIVSQVPTNEQRLIQNCLDKAPNKEYWELVGGYLQFSNLIILILFMETVMRIGTANINAIREIIKEK